MAVKGKGKQIAGKAPASTASSYGKRKRNRGDGECSGAPQKKKPSGVFQFVDDAAADADFEPEEDEDDLEWEIDDDFDFELPDIGAKEVKNVTKGPGKSSPLPFFIKEEEMNDDELEEAIKERYRSSGFVSFDEDVKEYDESLLVAHATKDLSVFRVKCMMGRERQAAFCLMQKFVDLLKIGKKLQIYSVFALDHVKGFFYVEADKACNVFDACNGLCTLYPSRIELVPRNEAPNLLSIQKKACGISKGSWVRMKNGKYKGDLAEVVLVNDTKKRLTIKLVPRIDLQAIAKKFGGGTSLKAAAIPAPRLISSHELEDFRPLIEVRRDRETGEIFEVLDGLMLKDGYLYKKVSMGSLIHWGVQPSSDELAKFEDLGKDEAKDVSWLSSIYKARMKKKFPETSHQTNGEKYNQKGEEKSNQKGGEKSNQKGGDKQRNGFDIDDLVLFGKKGCGIIIDKENDTFKVLKGDVNGSEVVSINIRVIKKVCVDKVFTATDRCMKTISIDDVVKVSEGPLEGREGFVRHMYKGVLFIYDECQSENNGFFCAKSEICDLVKKSRVFGCGKLSSNAGPSFVQSPIRTSEQDDNSQSFSRNRQSNSRGTFSVGQTLRICKGPLKGYLCRVIRMYRADITVKLDSLGKLLTVDEKLLSIPNSKRDDATAMQCDMFGSQEEQSTGGGLGMDNFEFNAGMSSFGRDSWNMPSCSSLSFPKENDSKDQNQGADPWGSKPSSCNGELEQGAANSWGKAPSSSVEQSSWNKMEIGEKAEDAKNDADAWNKSSNKGESSTDAWKNDTPVQKTEQIWSTKGANSGWDGAVHAAVEGANDAGGWGKDKLSTPDSAEGQILGEDGWNKAATKPHTVSNAETSGWEQNKLPSSDAGGSWNAKDNTAGWNKETIIKDKADGFGEQSGNWASPKSGGGGDDNVDSWDVKGKGLLGNNDDNWGKKSGGGDNNVDSWGVKGKGLLVNNDDNWGKSAASQEIKPVANNPWQNSFNSSVQSKAWKAPSADENQAADQTSSWDKVKTAQNHIGCEKSEVGATEIGGWKKATDGNQASGWASSTIMHSGISSVEDESQSNSWNKVKQVTESVGGWNTSTDGNQAAGWGASSMPLGTPSVELESQTSSWDKARNTPSSSEWQISKQEDATAKEGWNKEKSSDRDQESGWNKAGDAGDAKDVSMNGWDKAKSFEGRGFGQQSQGQWKSGDDWRNDHHDPNIDSDLGQGSGWSQGHSNNENGKSWGRGNSWNQQRDFDGGRGSNRGRGRGRYGGRGGKNEDNFEKPNDYDGGWRSGRGGGRYGGRGNRNEDNFEKPNDSDGGWRSGRGGGRGRNGPGGYNRDNSDTREFGRGRGRGRDRGQDQGQFQSSDWRNGRERFDGGFSNKPSSSWGSTEGSDWGSKSRDQHSSGVMDEKVGWNSGSSYSGGNKPGGWGTDPQDAGGSKEAMNENHTSSWSKAGSTDKQTDNWSKEPINNENLNTSKTIENNTSTWNQTSNDTAKETTSKNSPEASFADWVHGLPESKCTTNDDKWTNKAKSSPGDHGDTLSWKLNSNVAGDSQSGWSTKKVDTQASQPPSSETENNFGTSNDWGDNKSSNLDSHSNAWDSKKEPTSSHDNWGGKDSSANQSSDWNNGGGNRWSNQGGGQGRSENWSRGSNFGRGGGRGRGKSFSSGHDFGRNSAGRHSYSQNSSDASFESEKGSWGSWKPKGESEPKQGSGWTALASTSVDKVESASADSSWNLGSSKGWRDNNSVNSDSQSTSWDSKKEPASHQGNWGGKESSGGQSSEGWRCGSDFHRGRGRGRADSFSGGGRGPGRNSGGHGRGYGKEGNDGWQSFNSNQEFKTGGSWNGGGNAGNGSWGNSNQPAAPAKPWSEVESGKSSWHSPTGFGSSKPDSSKNLATAHRTKTSDGTCDGEQTNNPAKSWSEAESSKSSWDSPTGFGSSKPDSSKDFVTAKETKTSDDTDGGERKNDPWGSANASKMGQDSNWNSGSSDEKEKHRLFETDRVGSWDTNNAPSEDGRSQKLGSGWNDSVGEGEDKSSSGNGGGNSGW